ncbi:translesion error-prone DNA polymerase V subunit UmuC [Kistimonas scapharcae]|uniref:Translesion error-prone DNA polymerase V subunit UmuC n=1 Tax=Kistimonas scapharcae TaxID=1036133 RepID=A0ABP8V5F1_9GAMM
MRPVIALCDANAFYCSCERVFDPTLIGRPLGVLSNNDGCIVARTPELKALGVAMGTPAFRVRHLLEQGVIDLRSSNYALYGDMSSRFMSVLEQFSPKVEVYSIDEAFVDLAGFPADQLHGIGADMKQRVQQWTGLPIGVGIANNKTLAKLANYAAKNYPATGGVVDLTDPVRQRRLMDITPVREVWGVGSRIGKRLDHWGIRTAGELSKCKPAWIRKEFSVVLERTVCELQGESCIPWEEEITGNKHQIICSRSFGQAVTTFDDLHAALVNFVDRACEKLRAQGKFSREALIMIRTDPYRDAPQHNANLTLSIPEPTCDTRRWLQLLRPGLEKIYREGFLYRKAGFMLVDLCDGTGFQADLWSEHVLPETPAMMTVMDAINRRYGKQTLKPAAVGLNERPWHMARKMLTPQYTTRWSDILKVNAKGQKYPSTFH